MNTVVDQFDDYDDPDRKIVTIKNHNIRICSHGAVLIMEHPYGCDDNGVCRDGVLKYMISEGYLDQVDNLLVIDSYLE